jgi:hypothetical protein
MSQQLVEVHVVEVAGCFMSKADRLVYITEELHLSRTYQLSEIASRRAAESTQLTKIRGMVQRWIVIISSCDPSLIVLGLPNAYRLLGHTKSLGLKSWLP